MSASSPSEIISSSGGFAKGPSIISRPTSLAKSLIASLSISSVTLPQSKFEPSNALSSNLMCALLPITFLVGSKYNQQSGWSKLNPTKRQTWSGEPRECNSNLNLPSSLKWSGKHGHQKTRNIDTSGTTPLMISNGDFPPSEGMWFQIIPA